MPQNDFSKILLLAVDESLSSLGDSPKQAILFHLETSFKITKEQIPVQLDDFKKALEAIFGPGACYIEKLIVKNLHERLGLESENDESEDFLESVNDLRKHLRFGGECPTT